MDETLLLSLVSMDTYDRLTQQSFLLPKSQASGNMMGDVQIEDVDPTTGDGFSAVTYKLSNGQVVISYCGTNQLRGRSETFGGVDGRSRA